MLFISFAPDLDGTCCPFPLSPSGQCCDDVDECGVCGGENACSYSVIVVLELASIITFSLEEELNGASVTDPNYTLPCLPAEYDSQSYAFFTLVDEAGSLLASRIGVRLFLVLQLWLLVFTCILCICIAFLPLTMGPTDFTNPYFIL